MENKGPSLQCRLCGNPLTHTFVDLGMSPISNTQVRVEDLNKGEVFYPLHSYVCDNCWLVQLDEYVPPSVLFNPAYPYFSSYSDSWVQHARRYVEEMVSDYGIGADSFVVELASNDGYLLQHFVARGIPCLGVEPTAGTAEAARSREVPTLQEFFGSELAKRLRAERGPADLVLGNNVLAHVPDLNDFISGVAILLAEDGFATFEFPHLMRLMESNQFDTIYHEHFSYFSLGTVKRAFAGHGLQVFHVQELPTHGGSLRLFVQPAGTGRRERTAAVAALLAAEEAFGLLGMQRYQAFERQVHETKRRLLEFLIAARDQGKRVAGYGAPAKGVTLLNYCGVGTDLVEFTVDRSPSKQGTWMAGTRIPVLAPEAIMERRPDYVLILPWNLRDEIAEKAVAIREWGGRFVVPIPRVEVF
jgi:SAM-dependent methyltransferase